MKDKYNLKRFIEAQQTDYAVALKELQNGRKESHWIWYIFPQLIGLGFSDYSQYYGITCLDEAKAYLDNETLRTNIEQLCLVLMNLDNDDPYDVMGYIDAIKLKSSMTLFDLVKPNDLFNDVLNKFFKGERDEKTLELLNR